MSDFDGDIGKIIEEAIHEMPRALLAKLLKGKFAEAGVNVTDAKLRAAADHILSGRNEDFSFGDAKADGTSIEISDEDFDAIIQKVEKFAKEDLPEVIKKTADDAAVGLYSSLEQRWAKEHKQQVKDVARFKRRLEKRYGSGLNKLRMLVTIAREWGQERYARKMAKGRGELSNLDDALQRLQARACQVTTEIIALLESGFADGAMARWRTLHEIATVTMLLHKYGAEVAERYVKYQIVESKKALTAYRECQDDLGYEPYSEEVAAKIETDYSAVLAEYGPEFGGEYGWIAHVLGEGPKKRVTFAKLQAAADMGMMRAHYQMASYNVHASPKGIYFKLGLLDSASKVLLAGPSNAGLVEPAQNAGLSLGKITLTVCNDPAASAFENNVFVKVIDRLTREIPPVFAEADLMLKRDDRFVRRYGRAPSGFTHSLRRLIRRLVLRVVRKI